MTTTFRRAALASAVALGVFGASNSFAVDSDAATASATLVTPLTATKATDLQFGSIFAGTAGSVEIAANGTVTPTTVTLDSSGAATSAASFNLNGEVSKAYGYTFPATVDLTNGTDTMSVSIIDGGAGTGTLDGTGAGTITLGGTLTVAGTESTGLYENTTDLFVTVNYQ